MVSAPATGPGRGTGGSEGAGAASHPPWLPCPLEKRPACFSVMSPSCRPLPLPASSSWCSGEECTKATAVSMNTGIHCVQLPEGASWAEEWEPAWPRTAASCVLRQGQCLTLCRGPWGPRRAGRPPRGLPSRLLPLPPFLTLPPPLTAPGSDMPPPSSAKVPELRPHRHPASAHLVSGHRST